MTRKPDRFDRPSHPRYVLDPRLNLPAFAPSPGWRPKWWQWPTWEDLRLAWAYMLAQTEMITEMGEKMAELDSDFAELDAATNEVSDRIDAQEVRIADLAEQLANAQPGSDEAAALRQELADASVKLKAASARLRVLAADPSNPVPVEEPPVDGGDGAPLDPDPQPGGGDPVENG